MAQSEVGAAAGEPCEYGSPTTTDTCEPWSYCWDRVDGDVGEDEVGKGRCRSYCDEDHPCPDDFACLGVGDFRLCLPECDPLAPTCESESGCYGPNPVPHCSPAGTGHAGDPCIEFDECAPGLACITANVLPDCESEGCCTPWCSISDPQPCGGSEECLSVQLPDYPELGICGTEP